MEKLQRQRNSLKVQQTQLIQEANVMLVQEKPDSVTLRTKLELLHDVRVTIDQLDTQIIDQMFEGSATDDDLNTEYLAIRMYKENFISVKNKIEDWLSASTTVDFDVETASSVSGTSRRKFKLPDVELRKFGGDLKQWLGWWSQFEQIHMDNELKNSEKFQLPPTDGNYICAIEALKERFGRQDLLLQVYVRELLTLVISNVTKKEKVPLSTLYLKLESHLRSLSELSLDKADPATWLFPLVESSLSEETLRAWQRSTFSKQDGSKLVPPKTRLECLMEFIKVEVQSDQQISLAQAGFQTDATNKKKGTSHRSQNKFEHFDDIPTAAGLISHNNEREFICAFCDKKHVSDRCVKAQSMDLEEKRVIVREKRLCFQCLRFGHSIKKCKAIVRCLVCSGKHYPIMCQKLHSRSGNGQGQMSSENASNDGQQTTLDNPTQKTNSILAATYPMSHSNANQCSANVLLNTLKVSLIGATGEVITVRLIGDTGSQRSYIKRSTVARTSCNKLGDEWLQNIVFGGGVTNPQCMGKYSVLLKSIYDENQCSFELLAVNQICGKIPEVPTGPWNTEFKKKGIYFSDQGIGCQDVEILLGNDYWYNILTGRVEKLSCGISAIETIFGWTLGGRIPMVNSNLATPVISMHVSTTEITNLWSLEAIGVRDPIEVQTTEEVEREALNHFRRTVRRDSEGRYIVSLPWKCVNICIPTNRLTAEKRLKMATYKLKKEEKYEVYDAVFKSWQDEGLITIVSDTDHGHFLPHRPVFKESVTTPVRPVFDASCRTGKNFSLNECLHKGPNLIEIIPALLLRFREKEIGVTADIRKAFQMLKVKEEDQPYQKFLWWEDKTCTKIKVYQHQRVVFGMTCSPFLLGATISHHLQTAGHEEEIVKVLHKAFYVDNLVTSVSSTVEYNYLKEKASFIMLEANMELREWAHSFNGETPVDSDVTNSAAKLSPVLGILWDRFRDTLLCDIQDIDCKGQITKRKILSAVAQIFDPIGFTSPATLPPKLLLQDAWASRIGWDEPLPAKVQRKFRTWAREIQAIGNIKIPRHFQLKGQVKCEYHVFCDASSNAFAAVIYKRTEKDGCVEVQLLLAKSRLAPMKRPTIPRLELMACLVGVRLSRVVQEALQIIEGFHFWSDSTTALSWIRGSSDWGVFVNNRVKEILSTTVPAQWKHVPGSLNPADFPSRGCTPRQLLESVWWCGPCWLKNEKESWPSVEGKINEEEVNRELRRTSTLLSLTEVEPPRFSSYRKNVAIWARVLRFIKAIKGEKSESQYVSADERRAAEKIVIKQIQEVFPEVLKIGGILVHKDEDNILRVRTRLTNRQDTEQFICPILLPKNHPMVNLLIMDAHLTYHHAGIQFLMGKLREKYWILQSRRAIRRVLHTCAKCRRHEAKALEVDPAALPATRVNDAEPFQTTGVDLAGPLFLKDGRKCWITLFTCAVYRCVYLDLVLSLSTEAFLGALERFVNTHGRPTTICSDNGTNFVGAANLFRELDWKEIEATSAVKQIKWVRNPATASWWGGYWERLVRSVKDLLKRMLGNSRLTYDEFRTCLTGVTATINDRPLTVVTEDSQDLIPLTPSMFMRGRITGQLPETESARNLSHQYQKMKNLQSQLQSRFRKEYLSQLVMRGNEKSKQLIQEGDVVLVGAENKKRFAWPLGVVTKLFPGKDKKVRVAQIKTQHGILVRPLQRLYALEIPRDGGNIIKPVKVSSGESERGKSCPTVTRKGREVRQPCRYGQWLHLNIE